MGQAARHFDRRSDLPISSRDEGATLRFLKPSALNLLLFGICYAGLSALGKFLALDVDQQGVFWPPGGLFVAILLLTEPRHWWRWVLAAWPAEVAMGVTLYHYPANVSTCIFVGNTLEAMTGAYLVRWFCGTPFMFKTVRNVLAFVYFAVALGPICSATVGTLTLATVGIPTFGKVWFGWWSGDALGILIVAPIVLLSVQRRMFWRRYDRWQYLEAATLIATLVVSAHIIFTSHYPIMYVIMLALLWAALRFGLTGATVAMAIVSIMTVAYTASGYGILADPSNAPEIRIVLVHLFLSMASVFTLVVGANAQQQQLERRLLLEGEERTRRLIEASPIAIGIGSAQGQIEGNKAFYRLIGRDGDEALRDKIGWSRLSGLEYANSDREITQRLQSTGFAGPFENEYVRQDGTRVPTLVSLARLPDEDGYVAFILDMTEQVRVASLARESEGRLRLVAEATNMYSWEMDLRTRMFDWSPNAKRILGYDSLPLDADTALTMVHPEDREPTNSLIEQHLQKGGPFSLECRVLTMQGNIVWLHAQCTTIVDADGNPERLIGISQDITDRKSAEAALKDLNATLEQRVSNQTREIRLLAKALSHLTEGVLITDANLEVPGPAIQYVNDALCRMSGYSAEELIGKTPRIFQGKQTDRETLQQLTQTLSQGNSFSCELINYKKDGTPIDTELFITPLTDTQGQTTTFVSVQRDITARKKSERALQESEERTRSIVDTASDAIVTIDYDGVITSVNESTLHMFGYEKTELIGEKLRIIMPPPYHDECDSFLQSYSATQLSKLIGIAREVSGLRKDGTLIPIDLSFSEIRGAGYTGILRDTTDRKQLQQHVLDIAEKEQRRIGQELHDSIQQELTGSSMYAGVVLDLLMNAEQTHSQDQVTVSFYENEFSKLHDTVQKLCQFLSQTNNHVQQLARGIMPVQIEADGLQMALRELVARLHGGKGITCHFHCPKPILVANNATATHMYRIAQEALNNALRHSRAHQIDVCLSLLDEKQIALEIIDDGIGIDSSDERHQKRQAGMGLRIMDYRARMVDGWLQFERRPEGGTTVRCVVPASEDEVNPKVASSLAD